MKRLFNNLRFRSKIIWIFGITFFLSTVTSGIFYYRYTSHDIEESFTVSAEDVLVQLVDTLDLRFGTIRQRGQGLLTNHTFVVGLSDCLINPSDVNLVKTMGVVSDYLRDLETGENLIHSTYIYTDKGEFDNFVRMRDWQFEFTRSEYYRAYQEHPGNALRWFSVREDEIFQDNDEVIPYVRRFSVYGYDGEQFLVIQLKKKELERLLEGKYEFFDKILILDADGNPVVGSAGLNAGELLELARQQEPDRRVISGEYRYEGEDYLVTGARLAENGWQVFGLKSRQSLFGSLKGLRNVILEMMGVVFAIATAAILFLSHQLTGSLRRLEKRMSFVQNGDFNVRFFYPYKDEVGSLARGFNYMIEEIQHLVEKQEETIKELKWERDYVAEIQMQKRKAELNALQAQINPHFLYNTLNAITWQAADQGAEEISILSNALGKFFRVSLSKGAEIITLREELEHVTSYLDIQKIRYYSRLSYEIEADDIWLDCRMIKLILQPLAENSIYHGIKEKEGTGLIRISVEPVHGDIEPLLRLTVFDNGKGIPEAKLSSLNQALSRGEKERTEGYGIFNVNERIRLFYGEEYGLQYESVEGEWTRAFVTVPVRESEVDSCIG